MPNAFVARPGFIVPFNKVTAVRTSFSNDCELIIYISGSDRLELEFKSQSDLETQRNAFLAYLTPTTKPLI